MSPGRPDRKVAERHLAALERTLAHLRSHQGHSREELERDLDKRWVVERGLQLCAQNALDLATHVAASAGLDVAHYAAAIDAMASLGALDPTFCARFRGIAGFRNLLVHGYLSLDVGRMHQLLTDHLGDFDTFAAAVRRHLDRDL